MIRAQECSNSTEVKYFFLMAWPQVYSDDGYDDGVRGYLIEYLNCYCSIQSNYMDIFAIVISFCLANRFKQLNLHLERYKGKVYMASLLLFHLCFDYLPHFSLIYVHFNK